MRQVEVVPDTDEQIPETLRSVSPEAPAHAALRSAMGELGGAELRVLTRIAERLKTRARSRSALGFITRARAFRSKEARREINNALVLFVCAWIKAETLEMTR